MFFIILTVSEKDEIADNYRLDFKRPIDQELFITS
jgi:hypothetical protein